MANLATNILLGTLGVGGVATAVVVPTLMAGGGKEKVVREQGINTDNHSDDSPKIKLPSTLKEKECFSGVILGFGEGELIVCQDKSSPKKPLIPSFHLYWRNEEKTYSVEKITVKTTGNDSFLISFNSGTSNNETLNGKTITVKSQDNRGLDKLSEKVLKDTCSINYRSDYQTYKLHCEDVADFQPTLHENRFVFAKENLTK